ncbi:MAG: hypothetical protein OWR52_02235 [Acidibacillus sp.]|nr:hypothetical protein [Acidibacillus sp.]
MKRRFGLLAVLIALMIIGYGVVHTAQVQAKTVNTTHVTKKATKNSSEPAIPCC